VSVQVQVEVAYAEPAAQSVVVLAVPAGTTAAEAVLLSGLRAAHPGMPAAPVLGIWGRIVAGTTVLAAGDRVEVYRPLPQDPKVTRRALARQGRTMGRRPGPGTA
jgi:putative ubiquitin-RnfH superfamily antitoxin RatB of RatAB toxin-antitoxin module